MRRMDRQRREGMREFVDLMAELGSLRSDLDLDEATDMVWVLTAGTSYRSLVKERGWKHCGVRPLARHGGSHVCRAQGSEAERLSEGGQGGVDHAVTVHAQPTQLGIGEPLLGLGGLALPVPRKRGREQAPRACELPHHAE